MHSCPIEPGLLSLRTGFHRVSMADQSSPYDYLRLSESMDIPKELNAA